jgi:hypothetical protein
MPIEPGIPLRRDEILKRITEEQIFEKYLGMPVDDSVTYINPLRLDKRAGCRFYRASNNRIYFKDFSKKYHWDCFNVVQFINNNCSFTDAMRIIIKDFKLNTINAQYDITPQEFKKFRSRIQIATRSWDLQDVQYWNQYSLDISRLTDYRVYPCKAIWLNGDYYRCKPNDPCYAYYFGKIDGIDIIKLYFPFRKENRFFQNSIKDDNLLQGESYLKYQSNTLVLTKSYKDVMCFDLFNLDSVAPTSEYQILTQSQVDYFKTKYRNIVCVADHDDTGRQFALEHWRKYNIPYYVFPWTLGKDLSDNIKLYKIDKVKQIINETNGIKFLLNFLRDGKTNSRRLTRDCNIP